MEVDEMINAVLTVLAIVIFSLGLAIEKRSVITGVALNLGVIFAGWSLLSGDLITLGTWRICSSIYFVLPLLIIFVLATLAYLHKKANGSLMGFEADLIIKLALLLLLGIVFPLILKMNLPWFGNIIISLIALIDWVLLFIFHSYLVTTIINCLNFKAEKLDYLVVLGARLDEKGKVKGHLKERCDLAIKHAQANPKLKIIMSGGNKFGVDITEAEGMRNYAIENGIAPERIILETQATNTVENIRFSQRLIPDDKKFAVVSNHYHLQRALLIAMKYNIACTGLAAKAPLTEAALGIINEVQKYILRSPGLTIFVTLFTLIIYVIRLF